MRYSVEILRVAQKQLSKIEQAYRKRIIDAIRDLAVNPRPSRCRKLSGRPAWRIRLGPYRVIYEALAEPLASPACGGRHEGFCK